MKKSYTTVIVILVLILAVLLISNLNSRKGTEIIKFSTQSGEKNNSQNEDTGNKIEELEINQENNMTQQENSNELVIENISAGEGPEAKSGDLVAVHYTGKLQDGTVFDSSISRGEPIEFVLDTGRVIKGWDEGVKGMKVGEKRILTIPPQLAYGERGITAPDGTVVIPGSATLIFDVELVEIK